MGAQRLAIEAKQQPRPVGFGGPEDFHYRAGEGIDPRVVLQDPAISLYCLDHTNRQAIFVETPLDGDLVHAPFYGRAQYQAAQQLVAVSYDTLHQLASSVSINPHRLILVYSTGRCGSTLLSHALNVADGVVSFSEPAFYTQLVALRAADAGNEAVVSTLLRDCTKVFCASAHTAGFSAWGLKFRGFDIELGDLFYQHFPQANVVFLYRHAEAYIRSAARAFRLFEPEMQAAFPQLQQLFSQLIPLVRAYTEAHATTISPVELLVCVWVSAMERCLNLQRQGIPMICARYEDMQTAPQSVLAAVFEYCGLSVSNSAQLDRVLAQDSQGGTNRSRASAQQSSTILTEEQVAELYRLLQHYAPTLPADVIVPHTFLPQQT